MKEHSPEFLRKRKFLLVVPVLVLPFLTLAFWSLGGGKGSVPVVSNTSSSGLNMQLPAANLKNDEHWTKMDYYKQADDDSARRLEQIKRDPYYNLPVMTPVGADTNRLLLLKDKAPAYQPLAGKSVFSSGSVADANEEKVQRKLQELNHELAATSVQSAANPRRTEFNKKAEELDAVSDPGPELERLKQVMAGINSSASSGESDPELQQLNGMLDKLMDVQHPERISEKLKEQSIKNKGLVLAVSSSAQTNPVSLFGNAMITPKKDSVSSVVAPSSGFYSLNDEMIEPSVSNAIPAVIDNNQSVVTGATVTLRLTSDIYIQGVLIPKGQTLDGIAALNGERLTISINCIQYKHSLYPVDLAVYDLKGMPGIYIPGAITRDVAKQSADQSIQQLGLNSLDPSLGVQAASAGIEVTKNLLSKKVKLVKVMVKAGYQVLLKDNNIK